MVGGTTANDFSNCELKVMKQQEEQKQPQPQRQKQNPLGKGKTGMRFGWRAGIQHQGYALVCAKLALDILVVVIDRMTERFKGKNGFDGFWFTQPFRQRARDGWTVTPSSRKLTPYWVVTSFRVSGRGERE